MNIFGKFLALTLVAAVGSLTLSQPVQAGPAAATVNGTPIPKAALDHLADQFVASGAKSPAEARSMALKRLALDAIIEGKLRPLLQKNAAVAEAIDRETHARLNQLYFDDQAQSLKVDPDEIAAFPAKHPQFFGGRQTFHFSEVRIAPVDASAQTEMTRQMAAIARRGNIDAVQMEGAFKWAMTPLFRLSITKQWLSTEQLPEGTYATLKRLEQAPQKLATSCQVQGCTVLVLHAAYPDPADPTLLQGSITRNLLAHERNKMVKQMSETLLREADIKVASDEPARASFAQFAKTTTFSAPNRLRALWVAQAVNLSALVAALVWLVIRPRSDNFGAKVPKTLLKILGRRNKVAKLLQRALTVVLNALHLRGWALITTTLVMLVAGPASVIVFKVTQLADYLSELPLVLGITVGVVLVAVLVLIFWPALRTRLRRRPANAWIAAFVIQIALTIIAMRFA